MTASLFRRSRRRAACRACVSAEIANPCTKSNHGLAVGTAPNSRAYELIVRYEWESAEAENETQPAAGAPSSPVRRRSRGFTSEERWEQILRVAGDLFSRRGYLAVSVEDIASRIGIQKASLYHYMSSKEDILYVLERRGDELGLSVIHSIENAQGDASAREDPGQLLAEFIELWIERTGTHREIYGSLGPQILRHLSAERRNELLAIRRQTQDWVMALLQRGVRDGVFEPSLDPRVVSSTLLTLLNNAAWLHRSTSDWSEIASQCATFFLHGLQVSAA